MLKSLEEDYKAGNISQEKYENLYSRYQKVLRKIDQDDINAEKAVQAKKSKPAPSKEKFVDIDDIYDNEGYEDDFISKNYNILLAVLVILLIAAFISAFYIILFL